MPKKPRCPTCKDRDPDNFYLDRRYGEDNYQTYCKTCAGARRKDWISRNQEKLSQYHKKYREALRNDPERWIEHLQQRAARRVKERLASQVAEANRRAAKYGVPSTLKIKEWRSMILETTGCPGCGNPWVLAGRPELDHIIPLKKRGHNSIKNIQPICKDCHVRKVLRIRKLKRKSNV